mgnify:CR=1 FL=1
MTKEQIFEQIDEIYCNADGGVIQIGANGEKLIKEIIEKAINYTRCCETSCGWTCEKCGETVNGIEVTYEEKHDGCGGYCS